MKSKLAINAVFNFIGAATPALANLIAVPILVKNLGDANYGLLTLVLALVGYFSLLDISATQGTTRFIAEYDSLNEYKKTNQVISFGLGIYLIIGLIGMSLIYLSAPLLIKHVFDIPAASYSTALTTLQLAAVSFLFAQLQSYLSSIPQAMQRWGISSSIESFFGSVAPLLSMTVAILGGDITEVVTARLILSIINVLVLLACIIKLRPSFKLTKSTKDLRSRLLSFSAFSYLSTIASISYAYADRMILGILLGLSDITLYSIPTTLVNRLFGMTYRFGSIIYPAASQLSITGDKEGLRQIYLLASRYMTAINSFLILMLIIYGQDLLRLWVGQPFVDQGYPILIIIALGMLIDSMTNLPSLINNAVAHPRITGLFAVTRGLVGIPILVIGTQKGGIIGTALAHVIASAIPIAAFMIYVHGRSVPVSLFELFRKAYLPVLIVISLTATMAMLTRPIYPTPLVNLIAHISLISFIYCLLTMFLILTPNHKKLILNKMSFYKSKAN
jgi:O-antigen/teichoic acid export membrane protein